MRDFLFTSESVTEGHPDKLCDQISDAVLDACLKIDSQAKVACETATKDNMVMVFGEISMNGSVNYEQVVRDTLRAVGYDDETKGISYKTAKIIVLLPAQSREIAESVHANKAIEDFGAGDQGHVFGFACNETDEYMPLSHYLASKLAQRLSEVRKTGLLQWMRPDGKTQVTVDYHENDKGSIKPIRVNTVVISCQHEPSVSQEQIHRDLMRQVVEVVIPVHYLDANTKFFLNPSGSFIVGGPAGDSGLTGRKIIVDTYGGWGSHGGGAFSGKDCTKVDRSAAYAARQVAKSLVANDFCERALVQVSYAIGISKPISLCVNSFGTAKHGFNDSQLQDVVERNFDLRPGCVIRNLRLTEPIFSATAAYGHFGRPYFTWEQLIDLTHERPPLEHTS